MKKKGVRAWLIEWEGTDPKAIPKDKVAAILNPRLASFYVKKIVELLYANSFYTYSERIDFAIRNKQNPYPAMSGRHTGEMHCGHNPFLEAFLVDDLRVIRTEEGIQRIEYTRRSHTFSIK